MDGTLVNDEKKIDEDIYELLPKLKEKDIRFVVASGRQYCSLLSDFQEHTKDVVLCSENGAFIVDDGQELYAGCMTKEQVKMSLDAAYAVMNEMATFDEASIDDSYLEEIRLGDHFTVKR